MIDNKKFEKNNFIKIIKDKKVIIKIYNNDVLLNFYEYNFETNIINTIPDTNIKFAIALEKDNDEYLHFFTTQFNENQNYDSPTRTFFPGITDTYGFYRYIFDYKEQKVLKIEIDANNYLEISVK